MTRQQALFLTVFAAFLGGAYFYFGGVEIPSIPANFAKAQDFLAAAKSVGGLPWWSPMFMQGTSLAHSWSLMLTNLVIWIFSIPAGFLIGPKLAVVAVMVFGSAGIFLFLSKLTKDALCAGLGSVLFLLCPSLLTRAAGHEQFAVVCSMALLPWTFLALLTLFRRPCLTTSLLSAVAFAAVVLAYRLTGLMALPVVLLYALAEYFGCSREARPRADVLLTSVLVFFLLAVVPNLPQLRESGFVAMFEFGPFRGWQDAFSTKSALGWFDRGGLLTRGIDGAYAPSTANGGTYLGLGVLVVFVTALFRGTFHDTVEGRKARQFFALGLLAFWFSFGPKGVLGGHLFFLALSLTAPDFSPALGWFFLGAQVWVIFRIVPPDWPARRVVAVIVSLIYLVVPGFRILEWLPLYRNIRAPFDFFQVTGAVCVVISAAILARLLFAGFRPGVLRSSVVAAACCLLLLDASAYAKPLFSGHTDVAMFRDFLAAAERIKASPLPGRVYAFSGRYFYLLTPYLTGRPLLAEAFNNYLQQRGAAILQGTAFATDETLVSYMNISGVSHVLIDKNDPDTPADLQRRLRNLLPVAFENEGFVVLENRNSLGAGFLARDFIQATDSLPQVSTAAFGGARFNLAIIELLGVSPNEPGLRGRVVDGRIDSFKSSEALKEGRAFVPVPPAAGGSFQTVRFAPTGDSGWLVMNQAWHPDWMAFQGGEPLSIRRAFLAFQAVKTDGKQAVEFRFQPPWWYNACAGIGILSWFAVLGLLLVSKWLPASFRLDSTQECK